MTELKKLIKLQIYEIKSCDKFKTNQMEICTIGKREFEEMKYNLKTELS